MPVHSDPYSCLRNDKNIYTHKFVKKIYLKIPIHCSHYTQINTLYLPNKPTPENWVNNIGLENTVLAIAENLQFCSDLCRADRSYLYFLNKNIRKKL